MNKLQQLIQKFCPNGVEWKTLGECSIMQRGTSATKSTLESGNIPVISGGKEPAFYCSIANRDGDTITVAGSGAGAGFVQFWNAPIFVNDAFSVKGEKDISTKFLYYCMQNMQDKINATKKGGGVPHVHISSIEKFLIPVPPLAIQTEITRILDKFSTLTAELQAELQARKSQYEYYRNQLLDYPMEESDQPSLRSSRSATSIKNNDNQSLQTSALNPHTNNSVSQPRGKAEWKKLGDIGTFTRGNGLQKKDFTESGVGCIHYGQIYTYYGTFTDKVKSFVSVELAKKLQKVNKGDLVIANTGETIEDICKAVAWLGNDEIVTGGHSTIFKHNQNPKYIAYYFQTEMFAIQKRKYAKGTKVIEVSAKDIQKIKIPIPPLAEQKRIVSILDKFDTLTNSITEGLPKEIELRQKQYEYYLNKLLTFKAIS